MNEPHRKPSDKVTGFEVNAAFRMVAQRLAGTQLRRFMLWLDIKLGYGKRKSPGLWWKR